MERKSRRLPRTPGVVVPVAAIVTGSVALARDPTLFDVVALQHWWPLGLVVAGVALLLGHVVYGGDPG